ncbi:uncharacterized protein LOC119344556 [Triticum dicoccoides]|uniref:uncharacterized protein LOC119344556 n=1 Tax=Triticum dicoccoides TaxID=85692 RepID=UPI00188FE7FA|nr:uncharacterized protein LOC119344556 [Triticum dicoccoides]
MIWRPLFSATVPFSSFSSRDVDLQVLEFVRVLFMLRFNLHKRWPTLLYKELLLSSLEANHCLTTDMRRRFYGCAFPLNLDSYSTCCGHFWWNSMLQQMCRRRCLRLLQRRLGHQRQLRSVVSGTPSRLDEAEMCRGSPRPWFSCSLLPAAADRAKGIIVRREAAAD